MTLPLVVIPQYFGALVFDRRTSRYAPFDHAAAALLRGALELPARAVAGDDDDAHAFVDHFTRAGYFTPDGRLAGVALAADPPPDHLLGPLAVHVEVVAACNLTCTHCFAGELPRKTTLTTPELDRVFGELAALGAFRIGLTGGEPLLRKDLLDVIDSALGHGLHPCLTTNGTLLDREVARALARRELAWVNISLEGATAETNDRVRGAGTFARVTDTLRALRGELRFTLAFTITRDNAAEVEACVALAAELGAHSAVFRPVYPVGTARAHAELAPTFAQYRDALAKLGDGGCDVHAIDALAFSPATRAPTQAITYTGPGCGAANLVASISATGDVNPCSFLGSAFESGNVRARPFRAIWDDGHAFRRLRERRAGDTFRGGCRARALHAHGDAFARDPWHDAWRGEGEDALAPTTNLVAARRLPVIA